MSREWFRFLTVALGASFLGSFAEEARLDGEATTDGIPPGFREGPCVPPGQELK